MREFRDHVAEVYFPWPDLPTGRSPLVGRGDPQRQIVQARLEQDLLALRGLGLRLDFLLNASCYGGEAYSLAFVERVSSVIAHLLDLVG